LDTSPDGQQRLDQISSDSDDDEIGKREVFNHTDWVSYPSFSAGVTNAGKPLFPSQQGKKGRGKRGRPSISPARDISTPPPQSGSRAQNTETQDTGTEDPEQETSIRKNKLILTRTLWPIFIIAQDICEDAFVFEDPFPIPQEDIMGRVDAWKSAARQCNIKGAVPDLDEKVDIYVSNTYLLQDIPNIIQLRKARNNLKSRLVRRVKENIMEQYEIDGVKDPLALDKRIDYLLAKNRYFCKYQVEVYHFTLEAKI
jgi:hypothetical protein